MKIDEAVEFVKEQTGWDVAVCSLVGSRNYNLHTEDSDFDFVAFVIPPLGSNVKRFKTADNMQFNDLRKLPERLWKSYPMDLEIVFSKDAYMCSEMAPLLNDNRDLIAGMNLPDLYRQCMRKYEEFSGNLGKGTANT